MSHCTEAPSTARIRCYVKACGPSVPANEMAMRLLLAAAAHASLAASVPASGCESACCVATSDAAVSADASIVSRGAVRKAGVAQSSRNLAA